MEAKRTTVVVHCDTGRDTGLQSEPLGRSLRTQLSRISQLERRRVHTIFFMQARIDTLSPSESNLSKKEHDRLGCFSHAISQSSCAVPSLFSSPGVSSFVRKHSSFQASLDVECLGGRFHPRGRNLTKSTDTSHALSPFHPSPRGSTASSLVRIIQPLRRTHAAAGKPGPCHVHACARFDVAVFCLGMA